MGAYTLPPGVSNILQSNSAQQILLEYIASHKIDSISIYDLNAILPSPQLSASLSRFIEASRIFGVTQVNAIGASSRDFDRVKAYQDSRLGKFDGLLTEIEFWNGGDFNSFISTLQHMRGLGLGKVAAYIGWPSADKLPAIAKACDQVLVHCYVKDPHTAYGYGRPRIQGLFAANPALEIYPIFSAEGAQIAAGSEHFMGDWLSANSMDAAEKIFNAGYTPAGFQYYEYPFLKAYLK